MNRGPSRSGAPMQPPDHRGNSITNGKHSAGGPAKTRQPVTTYARASTEVPSLDPVHMVKGITSPDPVFFPFESSTPRLPSVSSLPPLSSVSTSPQDVTASVFPGQLVTSSRMILQRHATQRPPANLPQDSNHQAGDRRSQPLPVSLGPSLSPDPEHDFDNSLDRNGEVSSTQGLLGLPDKPHSPEDAEEAMSLLLQPPPPQDSVRSSAVRVPPVLRRAWITEAEHRLLYGKARHDERILSPTSPRLSQLYHPTGRQPVVPTVHPITPALLSSSIPHRVPISSYFNLVMSESAKNSAKRLSSQGKPIVVLNTSRRGTDGGRRLDLKKDQKYVAVAATQGIREAMREHESGGGYGGGDEELGWNGTLPLTPHSNILMPYATDPSSSFALPLQNNTSSGDISSVDQVLSLVEIMNPDGELVQYTRARDLERERHAAEILRERRLAKFEAKEKGVTGSMDQGRERQINMKERKNRRKGGTDQDVRYQDGEENDQDGHESPGQARKPKGLSDAELGRLAAERRAKEMKRYQVEGVSSPSRKHIITTEFGTQTEWELLGLSQRQEARLSQLGRKHAKDSAGDVAGEEDSDNGDEETLSTHDVDHIERGSNGDYGSDHDNKDTNTNNTQAADAEDDAHDASSNERREGKNMDIQDTQTSETHEPDVLPPHADATNGLLDTPTVAPSLTLSLSSTSLPSSLSSSAMSLPSNLTLDALLNNEKARFDRITSVLSTISRLDPSIHTLPTSSSSQGSHTSRFLAILSTALPLIASALYAERVDFFEVSPATSSSSSSPPLPASASTLTTLMTPISQAQGLHASSSPSSSSSQGQIQLTSRVSTDGTLLPESAWMRLRSGQSIVGATASSRKTILLSDAYKDIRFMPVFDRLAGTRTRSLLCVPVLSQLPLSLSTTTSSSSSSSASSSSLSSSTPSSPIHPRQSSNQFRLDNGMISPLSTQATATTTTKRYSHSGGSISTPPSPSSHPSYHFPSSIHTHHEDNSVTETSLKDMCISVPNGELIGVLAIRNKKSDTPFVLADLPHFLSTPEYMAFNHADVQAAESIANALSSVFCHLTLLSRTQSLQTLLDAIQMPLRAVREGAGVGGELYTKDKEKEKESLRDRDESMTGFNRRQTSRKSVIGAISSPTSSSILPSSTAHMNQRTEGDHRRK